MNIDIESKSFMSNRKEYIQQVINHYRVSTFEDIEHFNVNYTNSAGVKEPIMMSHNEGLDMISTYIKYLEKQLEQYEYLDKIITIARRENLETDI